MRWATHKVSCDRPQVNQLIGSLSLSGRQIGEAEATSGVDAGGPGTFPDDVLHDHLDLSENGEMQKTSRRCVGSRAVVVAPAAVSSRSVSYSFAADAASAPRPLPATPLSGRGLRPTRVRPRAHELSLVARRAGLAIQPFGRVE